MMTRHALYILVGLGIVCAGRIGVGLSTVDGTGILLVYNSNWTADANNDDTPDSQEVAEYYAAQRNVPASQILAVNVTTDRTIIYEDFYDDILVPIHNKIESEGIKDTVYYIVLCYGVPIRVNTHNPSVDHPIWPGGSYSCSTRCMDTYLIDLYVNYGNGTGYDLNGEPIDANGDRMGISGSPSTLNISNRYYSSITMYTNPSTDKTFKAVRDAGSLTLPSGTYLVCRIDGESAEAAKGLVDKALYAEKYLKYQAQSYPYRITTLIDSDDDRSHGHEIHAAYMSRHMQGLDTYSAFNPAESGEPWYIGAPFDTICDYDQVQTEVGQGGHLPVVIGTIDSIAGNDITFTTGSDNAAYFYVIGKTVSNGGGASATVTALNGASRTITVDDASGFSSGDTVTQDFGVTFPMSPMFIYTFYTYGGYRDVYAFPVGSFGKHMDSGSGVNIRDASSGYWCSKALRRNITSTAGAVSEPSSWGEAWMDLTFIALTQGYNAIDSWYNGINYGRRWMNVTVTDPLYTPLRDFSSHIDDTVAPVIAEIRTSDATSTSRTIAVDLGGASQEELLDVCQFKIEYGQTTSYGSVYDYYDFSGTLDGTWSDTRRYVFTRRFSCELTGLTGGQTYQYRVSAIDPSGNETVTGNYSFTQGGSDTTETVSASNAAPQYSASGFSAVSGGGTAFTATFTRGDTVLSGQLGIGATDTDTGDTLTLTAARTGGTYAGSVEPSFTLSVSGNSPVSIAMTTASALDGTGTIIYSFTLTDGVISTPIDGTLTVTVIAPPNADPQYDSSGFGRVTGAGVTFTATFSQGETVSSGQLGIGATDTDTGDTLTLTAARTGGTYAGSIEPSFPSPASGNSPVSIAMTTASALDGTGTIVYSLTLTDGVISTPIAGTLTVTVNASSDTTPPTIPGSTTVVSEPTGLRITWNASTDPESGVTAYRIYRSDSPGVGFGDFLLEVSASGTEYFDTSFTGGVTYYYRITSINGEGMESALSTESSATAPNIDPKAQSSLGCRITGRTGGALGFGVTWMMALIAGAYVTFRLIVLYDKK